MSRYKKGVVCEVCCGKSVGYYPDDKDAPSYVRDEITCAYCWGPMVIETGYPPVPDFLLDEEWIRRYEQYENTDERAAAAVKRHADKADAS